MKAMNKTILAAYLAIPGLHTWEDRFLTSRYDMIEQLCDLSGKLEFPLDEAGSIFPTIEQLEISKHNRSSLKSWFGPELLKHAEILVITATIHYEPGKHTVTKPNGTKVDPSTTDSVLKVWLRALFERGIYLLVTAANLSNPGCLDFEEGIIVQDGIALTESLFRLDAMSAFAIRDAQNPEITTGWPSLQILDIKRVWIWLIARTDFVQGYSNSSTGRALNAFMYLLDKKLSRLEGPLILLWALIGVEALYGGREGIQEQLREKSQVFLGGADKAQKARFSNMYSFRSSLVHGSMDFPGPTWSGGDPSHTKKPKYLMEWDSATSLAQLLLISSLQQIIKHNWSGVRFHYSAVADDSE
jgi:hypothetical protein